MVPPYAEYSNACSHQPTTERCTFNTTVVVLYGVISLLCIHWYSHTKGGIMSTESGRVPDDQGNRNCRLDYTSLTADTNTWESPPLTHSWSGMCLCIINPSGINRTACLYVNLRSEHRISRIHRICHGNSFLSLGSNRRGFRKTFLQWSTLELDHSFRSRRNLKSNWRLEKRARKLCHIVK